MAVFTPNLSNPDVPTSKPFPPCFIVMALHSIVTAPPVEFPIEIPAAEFVILVNSPPACPMPVLSIVLHTVFEPDGIVRPPVAVSKPVDVSLLFTVVVCTPVVPIFIFPEPFVSKLKADEVSIAKIPAVLIALHCRELIVFFTMLFFYFRQPPLAKKHWLNLFGQMST